MPKFVEVTLKVKVPVKEGVALPADPNDLYLALTVDVNLDDGTNVGSVCDTVAEDFAYVEA